MQIRSYVRPGRCTVLVVVLCFIALAAAQNPPANPVSQANGDWLAQTAKLYYSSSKAGLKGFDCAIRPDWQALYASQSSSQVSAADEAKVTLLNSVKIVYHARMDNGATVDWNPPDRQLDADQTSLLNQMHDALNQMLQGFMQFWSPFIESQVIPNSPDGLEMAATDDGGRKIHLKTPEVELFETFDSDRILRQYNVVMSGTKVDVTPTYSPDEHGLLITHFHAFIRPTDDKQKVQEMNVEVSYQWIDGFPIPGHMDMNVVGVAGLSLAFENCSVQH